MTRDGRGFDTMLFITYSVRADADHLVYEEWLRQVDNPFFNAVPGIVHYSNWKISAGAHALAPNVYFDFLGLDSPAALDFVWNDAAVNAFRHRWRLRWGIADPSDHAANSQIYLCERNVRGSARWHRYLALLPHRDAELLPADWDSWRVIRAMRETSLGFGAFSVAFGAVTDALEAAEAARRTRAVHATCVAAPGLLSA
jgi:hypothetical protein